MSTHLIFLLVEKEAQQLSLKSCLCYHYVGALVQQKEEEETDSEGATFRPWVLVNFRNNFCLLHHIVSDINNDNVHCSFSGSCWWNILP